MKLQYTRKKESIKVQKNNNFPPNRNLSLISSQYVLIWC
jgi:hypothetical protein